MVQRKTLSPNSAPIDTCMPPPLSGRQVREELNSIRIRGTYIVLVSRTFPEPSEERLESSSCKCIPSCNPYLYIIRTGVSFRILYPVIIEQFSCERPRPVPGFQVKTSLGKEFPNVIHKLAGKLIF